MKKLQTFIEKNEKKILPIAETPVKYSLFVADKMAVIMQHPEAMNWLLNNFIQMVFYMDNLDIIDYNTHYLTIWPADTFKLDQHGCNLFLRETTINNHIMSLNRCNLMKNIKMWIDNGLYVYANVDVSKLKNTKYYGLSPFCHSSFVYGYDKKNVYQLDFNDKEDFGTIKIPYDDYCEAVLSSDLEKIFHESKHMNVKYNVTLLQLKEETGSFCKLDKEVMKYWIKAYLESNKFMIASNPFFNMYPIECGLNIYDAVEKMVVKMTKNEMLDYRMFHVIYEHKKIMLLRIRTLIENGLLENDISFIEECEKMIELTQEMRHLCLKYNITLLNSITQKVLEKLRHLKELDESFMRNLYTAL